MRLFNKKPKHLSPEQQRKLDIRLVDEAEQGNTKAVRNLLADGANVDDAALSWATMFGYTETAQVLVEHIFAPDSWRGKSRAEIEARAEALYNKIKIFNPQPEHVRAVAGILRDCALDCWFQVRPAPPKIQISPFPAQPRPV